MFEQLDDPIDCGMKAEDGHAKEQHHIAIGVKDNHTRAISAQSYYIRHTSDPQEVWRVGNWKSLVFSDSALAQASHY